MVGNYDSDHIEYYEKIYGDHLDDYQFWDTYLYVTGQNGKSIRIEANIALLFIEGKVIVEYFQTEPQIINWLFRHSGLKNKLAGCIVSTIVG
jgi:hypothetical protein